MSCTGNRYGYDLNGPYRSADLSGRFVKRGRAHGSMLLLMGIHMVPVAGDLYSAFTGVIGFDPIAGISLSMAERAERGRRVAPGGVRRRER